MSSSAPVSVPLSYSCLLSPRPSREYTAEIMFETFGVPGLYIAVQAVLALAASWSAKSVRGSFCDFLNLFDGVRSGIMNVSVVSCVGSVSCSPLKFVVFNAVVRGPAFCACLLCIWMVLHERVVISRKFDRLVRPSKIFLTRAYTQFLRAQPCRRFAISYHLCMSCVSLLALRRDHRLLLKDVCLDHL